MLDCMSPRLKSRLAVILKYAICSIFILSFIVTTLCLVDHLTHEAYRLINHQIYMYNRKNLHWDREMQLEKVVQIVCLPIPCSLIFLIYEFIVEIYHLLNHRPDASAELNAEVKDSIHRLRAELFKLYESHDEQSANPKEFMREMRESQIGNILDQLGSDQLRRDYLKHLVQHNKYVIEWNKHVQCIDELH